MLQDTVFEIISVEQQCASNEITMEMPLSELGIDSLRAITILYELEERFDLEIPNELIENIKTVGDIVNNIAQLRQNSGTECQKL